MHGAVIRRVNYFYATVRDRPGEGYQILAHLAAGDVNLLAFHATPMGPEYTRLALFPVGGAGLGHRIRSACCG